MSKKQIKSGVVHKIPQDLRSFISDSAEVLEQWDDITSLARNEWICWITSAKKPETRIKRINQAGDMLKKGRRRPCCWPGCSHR